jgi:hypothetical protein
MNVTQFAAALRLAEEQVEKKEVGRPGIRTHWLARILTPSKRRYAAAFSNCGFSESARLDLFRETKAPEQAGGMLSGIPPPQTETLWKNKLEMTYGNGCVDAS